MVPGSLLPVVPPETRVAPRAALAGAGAGVGPRVARIFHAGVVGAWRERERALRRLGVDLTLVSASRWDEGGTRVDLVPGADEFVVGARTLGSRPNAFAYDPLPIWRLLRRRPPELLDIHEEPCSLAAAEVLALRWLSGARAPYLLYSAQNLDKRYPWPFRAFERRALAGAAGAYVCNEEAGRILRRKGLRGELRVEPLGVDLADLAPEDRAPPSGGSLRVGYVGRLAPHKGVGVLLDALATEPSWSAEIVGDGPERPALEAKVLELGLDARACFVGFTPASALGPRYRSFDVVVVPSLPWPGWREQFCRVAVEAMAAGVPVVVSDTGALPEVVGDAGVLVPPGDPGALREALLRLAEDPGWWGEHRAAGIARAGGFAWERVAEAHLELYRAVLTNPHPVRAGFHRPDEGRRLPW